MSDGGSLLGKKASKGEGRRRLLRKPERGGKAIGELTLVPVV